MNGLIAISRTTTGSFAALSSTTLVVTGSLIAMITSGSLPDVEAVLVEGQGATDVVLPLGVAIPLTAVDLSTIRVKSHPSGVACEISFIGHTVG